MNVRDFHLVQNEQYHCVFVYHLQTPEEEDEVLPQDTAQLNEVELRDRADSGVVNPGMEKLKIHHTGSFMLPQLIINLKMTENKPDIHYRV